MRTYHQLTDPDRSGLADQIGAQRRRVAEQLAGVQRILAVPNRFNFHTFIGEGQVNNFLDGYRIVGE